MVPLEMESDAEEMSTQWEVEDGVRGGWWSSAGGGGGRGQWYLAVLSTQQAHSQYLFNHWWGWVSILSSAT